MIGPVYFPAHSWGAQAIARTLLFRSVGRHESMLGRADTDGANESASKERNPNEGYPGTRPDSDPSTGHTPERRHHGSSHRNAGHEKRVEEAGHEAVLLRIRFPRNQR